MSIQPLLTPALVTIAGSTLISLLWPEVLLGLALVTRGLVDTLWPYYFLEVGGEKQNLLRLWGAAAPLAGFMVISVRRIPFMRYSVTSPMMAFFALNLLGPAFLSIPSNRFGAFMDLFRIAGPFVFFILAAHSWGSEKGLGRYFKLALASGLSLIAVLTMAGVFGIGFANPNRYSGGEALRELGVGRMVALYHDAWVVVAHLLVATAVLLFFLGRARTQRQKLLLLGLLALVAFLMYHTFLRAGWVAFVAELLAWCLLKRHRALTIFLLLSMLIFVAVQRDFLVNFYADIVGLFRGGSAYWSDTIFQGRGLIWRAQLSYLRDSPMVNVLLGLGLRTNEDIAEATFFVYGRADAHNDFIRILVDNGVIGLLLYLWLMVALFRPAYQLMRRGSQEVSLAAISLLVMGVGYLIMSLTGRPTLFPPFTWFLWGLAGVLHGIAAKERAPASPMGIKEPAKAGDG
ncbi:MAG: O-antigen ligase family protein [Chloroflexi bacterium]|nr:O-antigen ligase family protein [Chloroflexota bacterium]